MTFKGNEKACISNNISQTFKLKDVDNNFKA